MFKSVWIVSLEPEILWYLFSQGKFLKTERVTNTAPFSFAFDFAPAKSVSYYLLWGSCWDVGVMASPFPSVISLLPSSDSLHVRQWCWALENGKITYAFGLKVKCLSHKSKGPFKFAPYCCDKYYAPKQCRYRRISLFLHFPVTVHHPGKPRQWQIQSWDWSRDHWKTVLASSDLLSRLSYTVQGHLPGDDTTHSAQSLLLPRNFTCMLN